MSDTPKKDIFELYSEKFDNFDEFGHPSVIWEPRLKVLMQKAVDRGTPLTEQEVEAEFGKLNWEW